MKNNEKLEEFAVWLDSNDVEYKIDIVKVYIPGERLTIKIGMTEFFFYSNGCFRSKGFLFAIDQMSAFVNIITEFTRIMHSEPTNEK